MGMASPRRRPISRDRGAASWLWSLAAIGVYATLIVAEQRRPLRPATQPRVGRAVSNLSLAAVGALVAGSVERPIIGPLTRAVATRRLGLIPALGLPRWIALPLMVAAMDYTLYVWHGLTHRQPLWRLHRVHHADPDLDATTAMRFHVGELLASIPYRAAQVLLIGVEPRAFSAWRRLLFVSVAFHHANLRLPLGLERALSWVLVTPRLHGLHHSIVRAESDSNLSAGLTVWDRLHGTFRPVQPGPGPKVGLPPAAA